MSAESWFDVYKQQQAAHSVDLQFPWKKKSSKVNPSPPETETAPKQAKWIYEDEGHTPCVVVGLPKTVGDIVRWGDVSCELLEMRGADPIITNEKLTYTATQGKIFPHKEYHDVFLVKTLKNTHKIVYCSGRECYTVLVVQRNGSVKQYEVTDQDMSDFELSVPTADASFFYFKQAGNFYCFAKNQNDPVKLYRLRLPILTKDRKYSFEGVRKRQDGYRTYLYIKDLNKPMFSEMQVYAKYKGRFLPYVVTDNDLLEFDFELDVSTD